MIICRKCQRQNRDDANACEQCAGSLDFTDTLGLSTKPDELVGKILNGKYKVLAVLGEGGMGVVYKVRHLILETRNLFALKILHPRFSNDPRFKKRFMREVEVAMKLTHENIVQLREFGHTEDGLLFFTMDYFDGATLTELISKEGSLSPRRIIGVTKDVLRALVEAHRSGIVHRDLKPDNILVSSGNDGDAVRILDFGIAKVIEGSARGATLTQGGVIGTPKYMSPEQASGEGLDGRSDLYSLGVVLYEIVTGKVPFSKGTARSILLAHMTKPPPPFKEIRPSVKVPAHLEAFIFRLLAKDPGQRPASAAECLALLGAKEVSRLPRQKGATSLTDSLYGSPWRRPVMIGVSGLALCGTVLFGGYQLGILGDLTSALAQTRTDGTQPPKRAEAAVESESKHVKCFVCDKVYDHGEMPYNRCGSCGEHMRSWGAARE